MPREEPERDRWIADARLILASAEIDDAAKLQQVCVLLQRTRLLLVFDDFEQNLELGDATIAFSDPGFAVTSRYPPLGADAFLLEVPVPALSPAELRRLLLRLPALRELDTGDRRVLMEKIEGILASWSSSTLCYVAVGATSKRWPSHFGISLTSAFPSAGSGRLSGNPGRGAARQPRHSARTADRAP